MCPSLDKVTEAEQKLLSLLLEDPDYTYAVLAEKLGVSLQAPFTVEQAMSVLKIPEAERQKYMDLP